MFAVFFRLSGTGFQLAILAIVLSACTTSGGGYSSNNSGYSSTNCNDFGVVQRISSYTGERRASGAGAFPPHRSGRRSAPSVP